MFLCSGPFCATAQYRACAVARYATPRPAGLSTCGDTPGPSSSRHKKGAPKKSARPTDKKSSPENIERARIKSTPKWARTTNLRLRRPLLYPVELPVHTKGEGFEPSIRHNPYTRLAGERLQPLGHPFKTTASIQLFFANCKLFVNTKSFDGNSSVQNVFP